MSNNRGRRNARNQGEASAFNRLAEILERHATPPLPAPKPQFSIKQFNACNPPKYSGEEGATALLQWFEALENTFMISECPDHLQVRYATTVLTKRALTWWNGQKIIIGTDGIPSLDWSEFKELLLEEFCPANEIIKLEDEFNKLIQHGGDNDSYTTRFHELSLLVPHSVNPESRAIQKYTLGLPMKIQNHVTVSKPYTLSEAIRVAATISDNYVKSGKLTIGNKTKSPTEPRTSEPQPKKAKNNRNYAVTTTQSNQPPKPPQPQTNSQQNRKGYTGTYPLCVNCNFHHPTHTACRLCTSCNRLGHFAINCRNPTPISSVAPTPFTTATKPTRSCYECGDPTHFRNTCPKLHTNPAPQPEHNHNFTLITSQDQIHTPTQLTTPITDPQHYQASDSYNTVADS